ncbi:MAG: acetylglutamate kinase [Elusimicrobia bacterium]|nr:acetylglutamate kinase [Elusimicrobiota bacterium]
MTVKNISVFKIGGSVLNSAENMEKLFSCLAGRIDPGHTVVVHGGGNAISYWLKRVNIDTRFVKGQRVTDDDTMKVVEMVLSGLTNKEIVTILQKKGFDAVGLSGRDGNMAEAKVIDEKLGHVGEVTRVNADILFRIMKEGMVPVLSPVCNGPRGRVLNVNADYFAVMVAIAVKAAEFNLITASGGVIKEEELLKHVTCKNALKLIEDKIVTEGMIPKLQAAVRARAGGVKKVNLLNYEGEIGTCVL